MKSSYDYIGCVGDWESSSSCELGKVYFNKIDTYYLVFPDHIKVMILTKKLEDLDLVEKISMLLQSHDAEDIIRNKLECDYSDLFYNSNYTKEIAKFKIKK